MQEQHILDGSVKLIRDNYFGKYFNSTVEDIHVLVKLPEDPKDVIEWKCEFACCLYYLLSVIALILT
ncbi:hypothetical protein PHMEG_00029722 [Phytophthora megakarya]|uniref:Crinkler (CRN) n=1 Tax=Phytophthora megakarya TaxID=4795 RepID=A0A225V3H3_9STRA|nr:hypothetical protein PHMEG_00029722 [Phytophthora megakarya]